MSKILAVFGATGQQGGAVVHHVLGDPNLSQQFKIRAITRDITSAKALRLKEQVEVVSGDVSDPASLRVALAGVHTVFAVTTPSFTPDGLDVEFNNAKTIADVALEQGAKYIVFSTLPAVSKISGGRYTKVIHFDAKAKAEEYIRKLPIQSSFVSLGSYMENFISMGVFIPRKISEDTWALVLPVSPETKLPLINATGDTGKFVGAILAEPDKYEGGTFAAATTTYSVEEITQIMTKSTGRKIVCQSTSMEEFAKPLPPILNEAFPGILGFIQEFGYYGPDTDKLVAWAADNAHGKLHTLEEFLEENPLDLK